jgi:hypothetical protein
MEAKNLRIGNFIKDRGNKVIRIDFMEYQESGYSTKFGQRIFLNDEEVHPMTEYTDYAIPIDINEEWLSKLGFTRDDETDYRWYILDKSIAYAADDNSIRIADSWEFGKRKYVHELQNLFFALTGNELSIENEM